MLLESFSLPQFVPTNRQQLQAHIAEPKRNAVQCRYGDNSFKQTVDSSIGGGVRRPIPQTFSALAI